jgi:hypothetical protein
MILIDFFSETCCKGTEIVEGWYWYEDDGEGMGGPFDDEEDATYAAEHGLAHRPHEDWTFPYGDDKGPAMLV